MKDRPERRNSEKKLNRKDTFATYELILRLAVLFRSRCAVCHKKCITGKYFAIHHINYRCSGCGIILDSKQKICNVCGAEAEKTHKDFQSRLEYYKYLFPIVSERPKDFALVCNQDHGTITNLVRYKKPIRKRLFKLTNQSAND